MDILLIWRLQDLSILSHLDFPLPDIKLDRHNKIAGDNATMPLNSNCQKKQMSSFFIN